MAPLHVALVAFAAALLVAYALDVLPGDRVKLTLFWFTFRNPPPAMMIPFMLLAIMLAALPIAGRRRP